MKPVQEKLYWFHFLIAFAMKKAICIIIHFILLLKLHAQQVTWSKIYSNFPLNAETSWSSTESSGGYYILSALSCLDNPDRTCSCITKFDTLGNTEWSKMYPLRPETNKILEHSEKLYMCGQNTSGDSSQILLYCLDKEGSLLWQKTYGNTTVREGNPKLAFMGDNILIVCNKARQIGPGTNEVHAFIIDKQGNLLHEYGICTQCLNSDITGVSCDDLGTCLVSFLYCAVPDDCFLGRERAGVVSMSPLSNQNWSLELPSLYSFNAVRAYRIDTNLIAISWQVKSPYPNQVMTPPAIYFSDTLGQLYDTIPFYNTSYKTVLDFSPVFGKGLVIAGMEQIDYLTMSSAPFSAWLLRMDAQGQIIWERNYYDTNYQGRVARLQQVIPTKDGGYLACGTIINNMTGVSEAHNWLLKLDSMGCLTPGCDSVTYITLADQEPVMLNGIDLKLSPNPANQNVLATLPADCQLQDLYLYILNQQGKALKRVQMNATSQNISVSKLQNGLYHVLLTRENEILSSKKLVVQR